MNRLIEPKIEKWIILASAWCIWILAYVFISRTVPNVNPYMGMSLGGILYLGIMTITFMILEQRGIRNA